MNMDRISDLPWDVLDSILMHIPLKEAVMTSVLSTKWRRKWARLSQFVVNDKLFPEKLGKELRWEEIERILNQIQLYNNGSPIEKFKLSAYCRPDHEVLLRFVTFLFGKGLKEFVLQPFVSPKRFNLPLHTFTCRHLTRLELFGCAIDVPEGYAFEGFCSLVSLKLASVYVQAGALECLIYKCPNLESLTLLELDLSIFLRLHGTKLRYLKISSAFDDMCLMNNPFLETVDIRQLVPTVSFAPDESTLVRVIGCLQGVKRLALTNQVFEFLSRRNVPDKLPSLLENLKFLELREMSADNLKHVKVSLCLLKSAPNLEELHISVCDSYGSWKPVVDFMRQQNPWGLPFHRLKVLKFRGIWDLTLALHFIKHVLVNSPMLETVTVIRFDGERVPDEVFSEFERASERVKIISLDSAC